ncbi:cation:proton antiporter domain-containing protein [Amphritea balenae]|uniref:Sodium:proton antiporter n=1 Tax=Amphritea balenae TaxID=452629 RepID=A0A3P1SR16_9GAMM|nr:cation:proton antiporter [Amphritea balenae]RRC99587.1 sodium:proton antiporter [Amphritea balenae]GGK78264.1 sodium/hydrogen exchanger family protein [Amphritea balenae]
MHETFFLVMGLVGLLTVASLMLPLANRINFPYTVLLALAGSVLGILTMTLGEGEHSTILGDFLSALNALNITSEVVFFVFLPALIFESALNINARHLMADIGPILLLAVIGLLISTLLVGVTLWSLSGMGLIICLLIGTIVSATDPIAVIAIFKNLGAPKRLTILVEGESLFNDATAIVVFTILVAILTEGVEANLFSASGRFLVVFFGGALVGSIAAWLFATVIGRLRNMPLVEITLTICLAYLSFMWAEHYLHVSGVMAVVTAGLMINSFGRTQVSPKTWHALTETWEELAFWANSLIFFLVGLLMPKILAELSSTSAIALLALTIAAFTARTLVLFGVLPSMNKLGWGQQISPAFRTVMLWGGLRGAVSLALALVILESPGIDPQVQQFIAVLVTGFVLFTLFVNAPTMAMMMRFFKLDRLPAAEQAIRSRVMALSLSQISKGLEQAAEEERISPHIAADVAAEYLQRLTNIETDMTQAGQLPEAMMQQVGLATLVNYERELYLERFSGGLISASITRTLMAQVDDLLDGIKEEGLSGYQQTVAKQLGFSSMQRSTLMLQRRLGLSWPLARSLADRFEVLRATETVLTALIGYSQATMPSLLGEKPAASLLPHLNNRMNATRQALQALERQYPDYANTLQRRYLARVALRQEEAGYHRMLDDRVISQEVFNDLVRDLDKRSSALDRQPKLDLGLQPDKLVARVPLFNTLSAERVTAIAQLLTPLLLVPGEQVVSKGEPGDAMYFISSGAVQVRIEPDPVLLGSGDFFGELALLTQAPRNADVIAMAYCQLLVLQSQDFQQLLAENPSLQEQINRIARDRLDVEISPDNDNQVTAPETDNATDPAILFNNRANTPADARIITEPPMKDQSLTHENCMNKTRFSALYARCSHSGRADGASHLYNELIELYNEPHRHYHAARHIAHCLRELDLAREHMETPDAVELALWFHDAIYNPKARDNEQQSADLFIARMGDQVDARLAQEVVELILLTRHKETPKTQDGQFTVDIDLSGFGQPWQDCLQDTKAIRAESPDMPEADFLNRQVLFLQALLDRQHLYVSDFFRQRYEASAQANIRKLIQIQKLDP